MGTTSQHQKHRRTNKSDPGKVMLPAIPVAWVLINTNENDKEPLVIRDSWDIWEILTGLQRDYRSRIELMFSEKDQGFILSVTLNPVSIRDAYEAGIAKGKELVRCPNKVGWIEEDAEGLLWYSH